MKSIVILLSLFSTLSFAHECPQPETTYAWSCVASGDMDMGGSISVYGYEKATKAQAEESALAECNDPSRYFISCSISFCDKREVKSF